MSRQTWLTYAVKVKKYEHDDRADEMTDAEIFVDGCEYINAQRCNEIETLKRKLELCKVQRDFYIKMKSKDQAEYQILLAANTEELLALDKLKETPEVE